MTGSESFEARLLQALLQLEGLSVEMSERKLIQQGVEIAQAATGSRVGYLHYLNDDQTTIELGTWSRATRGCSSESYERHYPITAAGVWADSARVGLPCIHNDFAHEPSRFGMPDGHSPLERHLGVPVAEGGRVRLLIGVGNKAVDYDQGDVEVVWRVGRRVWALIRQRRAAEEHADLERRFRRVQEVAAVCGWEYDVDDDRLGVDAMFARLFRTPATAGAPCALGEWLGFVAPADQARVREWFRARVPGLRRVLRIGARRSDGRGFPAELKGEFRPRSAGSGLIGVGILQDISEQLVVEDLRRRADVDALTGLPNRHRLHEWFRHEAAERRSAGTAFAFLYIDLDGFKPVNDRHGHAVGDQVLCIVASRLQHMVRKEDLVVRLGGDEFAIVQAGAGHVAAVAALAEKVIASVSEPIALAGLRVRVGASIGVAMRPDLGRGLHEVSVAADRALYRAKAAGGGCWALEPDRAADPMDATQPTGAARPGGPARPPAPARPARPADTASESAAETVGSSS